ncbi:unnamed protein product [Orchesella dallaii]|uniref:F-box domain-containing protein n=1 Tax=Orchesella dallaii TaxID=48710 RepID=A0ABP1QWR2_9HEXA
MEEKEMKTGIHFVNPAPAPMEVEPTEAPIMGSWDSLPPELQEIILGKVDTSKDFFNIRLVHPKWRDFVDSYLEQQCLSVWTTWNPFADRFSSPRSLLHFIPVMTPVPVWVGTPSNDLRLIAEWNHRSLPLVENPKLGSPFPGSSIHITAECKYPGAWHPYLAPNTMTMAKDLCLNYGHYFTSIILSEFNNGLELLCDILVNLTNLKALTVNNVMLASSSTDDLPTLPPLPNLTHLKIFSLTSGVSQLLLNAYSGQLVSLETSIFIRRCVQPFNNLKELKLQANIKPNLSFPQLGPNPFPVLQNFSVIHSSQTFEWKELIEQVDSLPRTLVNFHLDVKVKKEVEEEEMEMDGFVKNPNYYEQEVVVPNNFTEVTTLSLFFPQNRREAVKIGTMILPKFPNITELNLVRFQYDYVESLEEVDGIWAHRYDTDSKTVVRRVEAAGQFLRVCPKLKKIKVHLRGDNSGYYVFYKDDFGEGVE